jgi:hypothetical protein
MKQVVQQIGPGIQRSGNTLLKAFDVEAAVLPSVAPRIVCPFSAREDFSGHVGGNPRSARQLTWTHLLCVPGMTKDAIGQAKGGGSHNLRLLAPHHIGPTKMLGHGAREHRASRPSHCGW